MAQSASPRDKLFMTAAGLFYERGYRAVGVDTIAAESGIGKMTLYRHYPSKDDLIGAYLRASDEAFWSSFEEITADAASPRDKLVAYFESLQDYAQTPSCRGCPFLNLAAEYPDPEYAGHRVALEHKESVRDRFAELAKQAGARRPRLLANALCLLMDGAYSAARVFGPGASNPAANVADAARVLIDAQCGP